jgi:site-specific recombinase XerD
MLMLGKSSIEVQMEVCFRHTRRNSYATRDRYYDSCKMFVKYLHTVFKMQNIRNLNDKHVLAYIRKRQEEGIAPKTIKNELCAFRYLHGLIQRPRYEISSNIELARKYGLVLEATPEINGDRAWTDEEFEAMVEIARDLDRQNIADQLTLCKEMGFRITEVVAMTRAQAEKAIRSNTYTVKGEAKNGKHREVPLSPKASTILQHCIAFTPRGGRLFVAPDEKVHHVVNRVQQFIMNHRDKVVSVEGAQKRIDFRDGTSRSLTAHGLRYNFIQRRIETEKAQGLDEESAANRVTKEVGHNRTKVIKVYRGG